MDAARFAALKQQVEAVVRPAPALLTYYLLTALLTCAAFPVSALVLYFRYHTLHFRFDDEGVSMGYGIFFRQEMHLTFARMQDIHLSQNLVQRWLGIGTVTIQTAGSGSGGDLRIEGVRQFEVIRDYLYARMRGVRPELSGTKGPVGTGKLLEQIRDELRAAAKALGGGER